VQALAQVRALALVQALALVSVQALLEGQVQMFSLPLQRSHVRGKPLRSYRSVPDLEPATLRGE
ncbi:MAG: hypothetical protein QF645_08375, partial [Planctomycetota bacterium]|nr:hypothetical protein [Planctomycetota bacterium]